MLKCKSCLLAFSLKNWDIQDKVALRFSSGRYVATRKIKKFHKRVTRTEIPNSEEKLFSSLSAF